MPGTMEMEQTLYVSERREWRQWLAKHHATCKEIWLIYYKKESGKPRIPYADAVEEAICYGWIDSVIQSIDTEKFAQKFTPRTNVENWSPLNCQRVHKLKAAGLLTPAGLAKIPQRVLETTPPAKRPVRPEPPMPAILKEALAANPKAKAFFESLAPSYRRPFCWWIGSAKREETLRKRLTEAIGLLESGQKLGMK
jgi:uncharacterized protein YdeI (YjbR/CyaY-like superfamily)